MRQPDLLVVDNHCSECGEYERECICGPCEQCGGAGETPDGSLCACMRCPECGTANPFEPKIADCGACRAARSEVVREAEAKVGWDPTP